MTERPTSIANARFWLIAICQLIVFFYITTPDQWTLFADAQGQRVLEPGLQQPRQRIKTVIGGVYSQNTTLFFRNSPILVESELIVDTGVTIQIETGVQLYFATGVGMKVYGTIVAIGNEFAHIQMLPYQDQLNYDDTFPEFRLVDGPTVRQGRLQMRFRDRWRSVCTMVTNWTSIDIGVTCQSMGYSDGGFWKWYRRENNTYPLAMPKPGCRSNSRNLWECDGFADASKIRLSENLCQGEDDIGLYCWGPPTFTGWAKHWKGKRLLIECLQIYSSPFHYVPSDPDLVSAQRESDSRLEFVDILYAGYDGYSKNVTSALYIEGVPPIMNGLRVQRSARDGIHLYEPAGPIIIANSTITGNRGHGLVVENTTDGRLFVNYTILSENLGDGIWYRQQFLGEGIVNFGTPGRYKRQSTFYEMEKPRIDICETHFVPDNLYFPHVIKAHLQNGTAPDLLQPVTCWVTLKLPPQLEYVYTLQFLSVSNRNLDQLNSRSDFIVCDGNSSFPHVCQIERFRIPIRNGVLPQSVVVESTGNPIYVALQHELGPVTNGYIYGDVDVLFRVHATVPHKSFYGLNVTNSDISNNSMSGIEAINIRDRFALTNMTINNNERMGVLISGGAADLWVNDTSMSYNWEDGMNVTTAGGSINLNTTRVCGNHMRGFAFHLNTSLPFYAINHEIVMKGRPANNIFYPEMLVADNWWGGILIGNYCLPDGYGFKPKVLISWVRFENNLYHPHAEVFACQSSNVEQSSVEFTGNAIRGGTALGFRMEPAVNTRLVINSNSFHNIKNSAILIRNARHPQLKQLPSRVQIWKNEIKANVGPEYIVSIGLNEDAPDQWLEFSQQNEIRSNRVINPFPFLKSRSSPYAALVVSSSNVNLNFNCFGNPQSDYEIATSLMEHAKIVDASRNNWGDRFVRNFQHRIFDQFNRYSLARINIEPYAAICNQVKPAETHLQENFRYYKNENQPFIIGGTIYQNEDLEVGRYTVIEDLHIMPGARLTIPPDTELQFANGIGMLENSFARITAFRMLQSNSLLSRSNCPKCRIFVLSMSGGNEDVLAGRLEVKIEDQWGTICNRSWTAQLAQLACNQLGLTMDPQYFENWRIYVSKGDQPMIMDNIRCEEREYDITRCRYDGSFHNIQASCRATEVVGLRCVPPLWAGVRYSLYASPPTITGQSTMDHWIVEKAGLFDFRTSTFSPALQIDWNYHTFHNLTLRDNFGDGLYIVYNDLTKKPAVRHSQFLNNRLNGIKLSSNGITIEKVTISDNQNAGVRYDPQISTALQRDIVSWLDANEQPELVANNVYVFPNSSFKQLPLFESQLKHRFFLKAGFTSDCPPSSYVPCAFETRLMAESKPYGMTPKLVVQIVNPPNNESDEEAVIIDPQTQKRWSTRKNFIEFPITSAGHQLIFRYTRSYGTPKLVLLVLYLDAQEYLDRFVHVYESVIENNQYGVSAVHYSNSTFADGAILNRWSEEKIWFQKVNFTRNNEAVVWIHSPQHDVIAGTPLADITWHIDNCSIYDNNGPVIDTHRDLYASANIFHWNFWSNTFANNTKSGINVYLPDTYDLLAPKTHSFLMTENRFQGNTNFYVHLGGYYTFANISSNNFTDNFARDLSGIVELSGMEKWLIMERNRFFSNWGHWMVRVKTDSQSLRNGGKEVPSYIQFNYIQFNWFIQQGDDYVDMYPRSYAVGAFGTQKVDIHYNRLKNPLMDFEIVAGCTPQTRYERDVQLVWSGQRSAISGGILQRQIEGQLSFGKPAEPNALDLKGRMYESKVLDLNAERWYTFPYIYRPFRPYRITRDLTIMPGATLTIEKNVEVHVAPNARILVLGNLICAGTLWQPIRFKPLNVTEVAEEEGRVATRYKRAALQRRRPGETRWLNVDRRHANFVRRQRWKRHLLSGSPRTSLIYDPVYKEFPALRRDDPYFQEFRVQLTSNGSRAGRSGFLELYNATTGEIVPSCDQQFTIRNAQVVCRELGLEYQNAYHWITPRYDTDPRLHLVKTYMEPRQCQGDEPRLDKCPLRMAANDSLWMCKDAPMSYNYVHCGVGKRVNDDFVGHFGGITIASPSLELVQEPETDQSILQHVEIVGGGQAHNETVYAGALQIIRRSPILENVNVTNSSMHGVQIISPRSNIITTRLNISDNSGQGISILSTNLQAASPNSAVPKGPLNIPYNVVGMLDICAAGKNIRISNRILLYYKYDSKAVDCIKVFKSINGKPLGFRFLQVNFYNSNNHLGRTDAFSVYEDESFSSSSLIAHFTSESQFDHVVLPTRSTKMAFHLRATAADGEYGFIAEVATLPSTPDGRNVEEVAIRNSRFEKNDRGAVQYRNCGEIGPNLIVEQCSMNSNGYYLYGNVSTSAQAMELHLHNTLLFLYRGNAIYDNRGGLLITAESSSAVARLLAIIKNSAFVMNTNSTAFAVLGNNFQRVTLLNNIFSRNFALYFDTLLVQGMSVNLTRNLFINNTGLHTVDTQGQSRIAPDSQYFEWNSFVDNIALGHGNQYLEHYGHLPMNENDEFRRRPKRQILTQRGVSFDWWTHVGSDTGRYRATVVAGSSNQRLHRNIFNNPLNDFELALAVESQYDTGVVDARLNYWGYPGTPSVAAGKILDQSDYPYLIRANYEPILESNTSLVEGDCPPGWFQVGNEEFKSCFMFVGASMTFNHAVKFCEEMDAFMPILRADDSRQKELASRIDGFGTYYITEAERHHSFGMSYDIPIWVSSVSLPSNQCGWMSSRTAAIAEHNCNNLLPFVCERGTKPYQEPVLWRRDILLAAALLFVLLITVALLLVCACRKAQKRTEHRQLKKQFYRDSIRHSRSRAGQGNGRSAVSDVFDTMNPRSSVANFAAANGRKNGRLTKGTGANSTVDDAASCSTCTGSGGRCDCARTSSSTTDRTYASLPTTAATSAGINKNEAPPAYCDRPPGKDGRLIDTRRRPSVSLRPDPYEATSTFRSPQIAVQRQNSGAVMSGTYDEMSASFMSTTSCTSSACCASANSSRTTAVYCSTCSPPSQTLSETPSMADSPQPPGDSFDETASARSLSSDSTVTGVPVERPLLRSKVSNTQRTIQSTSRRSLASSSSTATILQASSRTDATFSAGRNGGGARAEIFRSGRSQPLSPSRSNPDLLAQSSAPPLTPDAMTSLSRHDSARSALLPPAPPSYNSFRGKSEERRGTFGAPQPTSLSQILQRGIVPVAQTIPQAPRPQTATSGYVNINPNASSTPPHLPSTSNVRPSTGSGVRRPGRLPSTEDDRYIPMETSM
ncbi:hypothetical protein M3Y94_00104200 [Aphelenchoides besseyi]|nr:hypothetical protein M3Y94_00104200 [Aphelenchoides besseyi]